MTKYAVIEGEITLERFAEYVKDRVIALQAYYSFDTPDSMPDAVSKIASELSFYSRHILEGKKMSEELIDENSFDLSKLKVNWNLDLDAGQG